MKYISFISKIVFFIMILIIVVDHFELYRYLGLSQSIIKTIGPFGIGILIFAGILVIIEWVLNRK
ncbi:hypothetical protein COE69_20515 [Bacillus wiedmannii]|nr:hypothetical protein CN672_22885 [Bacillus wiedmannii]PEJ69432.1 hypothetical protein CN888_25450 [Bacillus wiedmannii]PEM11440.1 hypothetical protein CN610_10320 [Bacillus wiedmannii]PHA30810.1 hypothetical protein COE69_20515 [Bacillus wiedmannii]PHD07534.1 hypothetical protein COF45_23115 [Bacillus wiedmannii]